MSRPADTSLCIRLLARFLRPFPDGDAGFMKPVRKRAVNLLALRSGARALDVACGPGGGLPYVRDAVRGTDEVFGWMLLAQGTLAPRQR